MPRVPRNKIKKKKLNLLMPVNNLLIFGSENDPCFSKLYSPSAPECQECGDSEICIIAMAQRNKIKNQKLNEKGNFKDMEEVDQEILKVVKNLVITNALTDFTLVAKKIKKHFALDTTLSAKKAIRKCLANNKKIKLIKKDGTTQFKVL
jgi:hypothetical protein